MKQRDLARVGVPAYTTPTFETMTARLPRVVNLQWLSLALTDQIAASDAGTFLPWDDAQLLAAARFVINQTIAGGTSMTVHARRRRAEE